MPLMSGIFGRFSGPLPLTRTSHSSLIIFPVFLSLISSSHLALASFQVADMTSVL